MNKSILAAVASLVILALAGCSSPQKTAKGKATAGAASTDTIASSAKKVEQDFTQTQSDFSKLESMTQFSK